MFLHRICEKKTILQIQSAESMACGCVCFLCECVCRRLSLCVGMVNGMVLVYGHVNKEKRQQLADENSIKVQPRAFISSKTSEESE